MILFKLRCACDHEFDAWFRDNAAYDRQHSRHLIDCPACGAATVEKAPMAPRVRRGTAAEPPPPQAPAAGKAALPTSPAQLRQLLRDVRRHVETNCEHVGDRFAEEARRIHDGDAEARGIYGDATEAEVDALADDGIDVARIPWVPGSDA